MGRYVIEKTGDKTVVKKTHPVVGFLVVLLAVGFIVSAIAKTWELIIPTVAVIALLVWAGVRRARR